VKDKCLSGNLAIGQLRKRSPVADDHDETYKKFKHVVNMSASQIAAFLTTDNSKKVGQTKSGETESIGHKSGKQIIEILGKLKAELDDGDYHHMKRVISYVARHTAQGGPTKNKETSDWRYSLMNWGHDPCK
jgi:hypothetical protein